MKKSLCFLGLLILVLAAWEPLFAYDTSPSNLQIVPEAIYAAATGGGTWVTELQILSVALTPADVLVYLAYSGGSTASFQVCTGLEPYHSVKFTNILSTLDALDSSSFIYYGRVGTLWISTVDSNSRIQVQAKTVNGNYGKTFPGLNIVTGNTAALGRSMIFLDVVRNATYRTFIGAYNTGSAPFTVRFMILTGDNGLVGYFDKTLPANAFISFNPFTEAGAPAGDYDNCWLTVDVMSGATGANGVMCFGSIANNYTNDTYALIARMWN